MKEIPNRQTTIPRPPPAPPSTFADLIRDALDFPPQPNGFTPAVMRARARVDAVLEKAAPGDVIKFEDADYETAKAALANAQWRIRSPHLVELFDLMGL